MGSGLSMTSVNKIKELAESREYSFAVDILDSQDLSKSLNPQFLRLCGVIYTKVGRYVDARRMLIMAHKMAPEAKRVIFSFVELYLITGYFDLAKKYYDIYMFDASPEDIETKKLRYIYGKAMSEDMKDLADYIVPVYSQNLDYDWSFEAVVILHVLGDTKAAENISNDYIARFKDTSNAAALERGDIEELKSLINIYAKKKVADDDLEQQDLREEEQALLANDEKRMYPGEPVITAMVDDNDEDQYISSKRKLMKFFAEDSGEAAQGELDNSSNVEQETKGFFKRVFSKKKKSGEGASETAKENSAEEASETVEEVLTEETSEIAEEVSAEETSETVEEVSAEETSETVEENLAEETSETVEENLAEETSETAEEVSDVENINKEGLVDNAASEEINSEEDSGMREIHIDKGPKNNKAKVSIEFGDEFIAEADTIDALKDEYDYSNPFDSLPNSSKKDKIEFKEAVEIDDFSEEDEFDNIVDEEDESYVYEGEVEGAYEDLKDEPEEKPEPEPEPAVEEEMEPEPEVEEEIEFESEPEPEVEEEVEFEPEPEPEVEEEIESESEPEPEVEEEIESEPEPEPEIEEEIEFESEPEPEVGEEIEFEPEPEPEVEEEIEFEPEPEPEVEEEIEFEPEPEPEVEEEIEFESEPEPEVEEEIEFEPEPEPEVEEEIEFESEPEPEVEEEIEFEPEPEPEPQSFKYMGESELDRLIRDTDNESKFKTKYELPVFKTSMFPEHNIKKKEIENNFKDVMDEGEKRMRENLLKEEQMQREAEALLASLGIDLGDMSTTGKSADLSQADRKKLKQSLAIDDTMKNKLKRLKEIR